MNDYANSFAVGLVNGLFIAIPMWGAMIYGAAYAFGMFYIGG